MVFPSTVEIIELERVLEVIYCSVTYKYGIVRGHLLLSSHCVARSVLMITKRAIQRAVHKKKGVPAPQMTLVVEFK